MFEIKCERISLKNFNFYLTLFRAENFDVVVTKIWLPIMTHPLLLRAL